MTYAKEWIHPAPALVAHEKSVSISFGPLNPGLIDVWCEVSKAPGTPPPPPGGGSIPFQVPTGPEDVPGGVLISAAVQAMGTGPSSNDIWIELLDPTGRVVRKQPAKLDYQVPEPTGGGSAQWQVRVTNQFQGDLWITTNVTFVGYRELQSRPVDLGFLGEKAKELFNDQQPFQLVFENRQVGIGTWTNPQTHEVTHFPIIHSIVRLKVSEPWSHEFKKPIEKDLGGYYFKEGTASSGITLNPTIVDGRLAFKLAITFPPGIGVLHYNVEGLKSLDWAIKRLDIQLFIVERIGYPWQSGVPGFEALIQPTSWWMDRAPAPSTPSGTF